jgi:C-terminal processing protease CtpA/Prc
MKIRKDWKTARMSASLIAVALCLQLPLAARADEAGGLQPEAAQVDAAQSANAMAPTTLFGSARKHLDNEATPLNGTASDNDAKLQAEKAKSDLYKAAAQKLANGQRLSAEEYRSLNIGCTGFECDRTFFTTVAKVTTVYRGSPADEAGIKKGDKLLDYKPDNDQAKANPTVPQWSVTLARAGTPMVVTVMRHKQPVNITLVRMNIEDIQDAGPRHQWEKIVSDLGYPKQGTFTGTSLKTLAPEN